MQLFGLSFRGNHRFRRVLLQAFFLKKELAFHLGKDSRGLVLLMIKYSQDSFQKKINAVKILPKTLEHLFCACQVPRWSPETSLIPWNDF